MFKLLKFILKIAIAIAVIFVIVLALARLPLGPVSNVAKTAEAELMQLFDQNAVTKKLAQDLVEAETDALAKAMNVTTAQAESMLKDIDFAGWKSIELPANAVATKTISGSSVGINGAITLYSSQEYLTLTTGTTSTTLQVPEGARKSVSYLYFL